MRAAIAAAKRPATVLSAQDSIPFERMFPDGICRVEGKVYSKTIQFQDINYQLSQNEDKDAIFDGWCDFLNYFDASVKFQFSFVNSAANKETYRDRIAIPLRGDEDDSLRAEYSRMLQDQLERGNNGLIKNKYLTFGIDADGYKVAKPRLERLETDILNNFRKLGVKAEPLDGRARLALMHGIFHIDGQEQFKFDWKLLAPSGLSVKDFIAPSSFEFASSKHFKMGAKYGAVSFLNILAPELNDRLLADLLDMDSSLVVGMHVKALDQLNAIKTVKRKLTELNATKIQEQKKAVRAGYDMDILPSDLATYGTEAQKLLQELQSRNERMFLLTFVVVNTADSLKALNNTVLQAKGIAQKHNCQLVSLDFQQEDGLVSCLPLALNRIEIQRGLTTSSLAIFVPFTTQELFQREPGAFYCGTNALSGNLIMVDRLTLDYLQALYEKRLVTYPRTDSRYLTDGMEAGVPELVSVAAKLLDADAPVDINAEQVCDSSKVTDHHAVVPTQSAVNVNISALPEGEAAVMRLVCRQLLCAVSAPFTYAETMVEAECGGHTFKARGKTIIDLGWRAYKGAPEWTPLPELTEGENVAISTAALKEGKTTPPAAFTEAICCERGIRNRP